MATFNNNVTGNENAIEGLAVDGRGVVGKSDTNYGMRAHSKKSAGIRGSSDEGRGVEGWATDSEGVVGISTNGSGVWGQAEGAATGVKGTSKSGIGVLGESENNEGVRGVSHSKYHGVVGINDWRPRSFPLGTGGNGGWFESDQGEGVRGTANNPNHGGVVGVNTMGGAGVFGTSENGVGVSGTSANAEAVHAETKSLSTAAIAAYNLNEEGTGAAIYAKCVNSEAVHAETTSTSTAAIAAYNLTGKGTGAAIYAKCVNSEAVHAETHSSLTAAMAAYQMTADSKSAAFFAKHHGNLTAARFEGDVEVTGDIRLTNADCAEDFDIAGVEMVEAGTVMVLCDEGTLKPGERAYDKRVAGVISGAGDFKPGIVLDKQSVPGNRSPVALLGKVFCKVDASYAAIEIGDLLTTSDNPGHAMKAADPLRAFGAVIGKALQPWKAGQGLIPILVALQ